MEKRVVFPKGKQKKFLEYFRNKLKFTWPEFAKKININRATLEKSYRWEYCRLPYNILIKICKLTKISKSKILIKYNAKVVNYDPRGVIGRRRFGEKMVKLPKIKIDFESQIPYFDTSKIKLTRKDKTKNLKFPKKLTPELAEEIGMSYGDGFLSSKKFEYRLKGNKNERKYYDLFIKQLYKNLFNIDLNIKEYETTYGFELYSKGFWTFKNKILGISAGRKDNIKLIDIVKVNDIRILTSFIRGLFDTDGSTCFIKKYKKFGNYYPSIGLTLKAKELILEVAKILSMLGLDPKVSQSMGLYWRIDLNGISRLERYSKLIGWSNPKYTDKVIKWKRQYPKLGRNVMAVVE